MGIYTRVYSTHHGTGGVPCIYTTMVQEGYPAYTPPRVYTMGYTSHTRGYIPWSTPLTPVVIRLVPLIHPWVIRLVPLIHPWV